MEHEEYWTEVQLQFEVASKFVQTKLFVPEVSAVEFLTASEEEREGYLLMVKNLAEE